MLALARLEGVINIGYKLHWIILYRNVSTCVPYFFFSSVFTIYAHINAHKSEIAGAQESNNKQVKNIEREKINISAFIEI